MPEIQRSVTSNFHIGQLSIVNNLTTLPIYGSIEKADNYFSLMLQGMRWNSVDRTTKLRALVSATKLIETLNFIGRKASAQQPLQFPRGTDTTTPVAICEATYELALALLKGIDPNTEKDNLYAQSQVYGSIRKDYNRTAIPMHTLHGIPCPTAWNLLLAYLEPKLGLTLCRVD